MKKTVLKSLLVFGFLGIFTQKVSAQSLSAGDIAFIGYNTDSPDAFSIITLTDIPGSEEIYFTDQGIVNATTWLTNGEDHWRFTAPAGGISCGTVINFQDAGTSVTVTGVTGASMVWLSGGVTNNFNLSAGDQMMAYQVSTPGVPASPSSATFIAAIHGDDGAGTCLDLTTGWSMSACVSATSESIVPPGLTNGVNCVSLFPATLTEQDNARYNGTLTGTSSVLRGLINDRTNWISDNSTPYNISPGSYSPSVTCAAPCTSPDVPTVSASLTSICQGGSTTLSWAGANLNDATNWHIYTTNCGTGQIASQTGTSLVVNPTVTTTYFIRGEGGCVTPGSCGQVTVTVNVNPTVTFTAPADLCIDAGVQAGLGSGSPTGGVYSGPGVTDDGNGSTYSFDPAAAGVGTHTITYTFTNGSGCTGNATDNVEVFALPTVTFTAPSDLCVNAGVQAGLGGGNPTGGVYSGPGVTDNGNGMTYSFDPAAAGVGTHTITYTFTNANGCTSNATDNVEVFALPTVTFTAPSDLCVNAGVQTGLGSGSPTGGVYSGPGVTDNGNGSTYSFDPAAAGVGTHTITYTFTNANGCTSNATDNIEVFALPTVTFTAPADLCVNAGVQTGLGSGSPTGGVYSGPGVTDNGNGSTYSFDPAAAGVGTHTITYTFTNVNGCTSSANDDVEVFALPTVTFTAPADLCVSDGVQAGLGGGNPTGGVYSGTGVTDDGNGTTYSFDPAAAGVGTHTITYTFTNVNGCTSSANDDVEVFGLPTVTFTTLADLCVDAGVQTGLGSGSPTGGVYSGTGVTDDGNGMTYSFDPAAAGVGTHTVTYTVGVSGCSNNASDNVGVFDLPTVAFTAPSNLCVDAGVQTGLGSGSPTGGVYSGTGVTDDGNGMTYSFDPAAAGVGTHTITYTLTNANGCTNSASDDVEVFALPTVTFTALADLCVSDGVQAGLGGGIPTGGVYSGAGVTDDGNGTTYSFDPAAAGVGTHTITYTFTNVNGCTSSASDDVEVFGLPTVTFTSPTDLCLDAGVQTGLGSGSPTGGIYSGAGITDDGNGTTYSFDPATAGMGTHTITYTVGSSGCTANASDDVEVFSLPSITVDLVTDALCSDSLNGAIDVTTSGNGTLTFDWDNDGTGDNDDTEDLSGLADGTYTLVVTDVNGCTSSSTSTVSEPTPVAITVDNTTNPSACGASDGGIDVSVLGGTPGTGYTFDWDNDGTGDNDDTQNLSGLAAGTYILMVTDANGCPGTATASISDPAAPTITFVALADLCENEAVQTGLGGGTPTGGTYSGTGVTDDGNGTSYSFDPSSAGVGTHTITYTYTDGAGCTGSGNDDVEVFAVPVINSSTVDHITCSGYGNGSINVVTSGTGISYDWDIDGTGDFNDPQNVAGLDSGSYVLTIMNANGCTASETYLITEPSAISLSATSTDEMLGSDGTIDLTVSGGTPNYVFDWDNDGTGDNDDTDDLSGLTAGSYTVIVYDDNGCSDTLTIDVGTQVSVPDMDDLTFNMYPNPSQGSFTIEMSLLPSNMSIEITTIEGKTVLKEEVISNKQNFNLDGIEKGIYLAILRSNNHKWSTRLIIQ